ncbi:MAG: hypothetical protein ACOYON_01200 [Fimbriimonas sp.]
MIPPSAIRPLGQKELLMTRRQSLGTTLIEVLVAIVVLLVGILAVVQIFPGGFRILSYARSNAVATQLARDEIERIKSRPDQLPEEILPLAYTNTGSNPQPFVDANRRPTDIGPVTNRLSQAGLLQTNAGGIVGEWPRFSGANVFRRIINEGVPLTPPRAVSPTQFGMLSIASFAPMERLLSVKGPDLLERAGVPEETIAFGEYFLNGATLYFPTRPQPYGVLLRFTGYVERAGTTEKQAYRDVLVGVPSGGGAIYSLNLVSGDAANPNPLGLVPGEVLRGFDRSERFDVALAYRDVTTTGFTNDPFEFSILDYEYGIFLFNPQGYNIQLGTLGGKQPLKPRISYDIRDWRILREEFRVADQDPPRYRLAVGSLKVANAAGPDGRPLQGIIGSENAIATSDPLADHFLMLDLETGGIYYERFNGVSLIRLDKTNGVINFVDADGSRGGYQARIRLQDGSDRQVDLAGRAVRVLYMANNEWAVQLLKASNRYGQSLNRPGAAEYYLGGSGSLGGSATRIYFPQSDLGRKVQVGNIYYRRAGDTRARKITDQDFVVRGAPVDGTGLAYIDIRDVDADAVEFDQTYGFAVRDVRSGSIAVRVLWNPERFNLVDDPDENIQRLEKWGRSWRKTTVETYLTPGEQN